MTLLAFVMWEARPDQMIIKVLSGFTIYEITELRTSTRTLVLDHIAGG